MSLTWNALNHLNGLWRTEILMLLLISQQWAMSPLFSFVVFKGPVKVSLNHLSF